MECRVIESTNVLEQLTDEATVAAHFDSIALYFRDSTDEQMAEICRLAMQPAGYHLTVLGQESFVKACIAHTIACVLASRQAASTK